MSMSPDKKAKSKYSIPQGNLQGPERDPKVRGPGSQEGPREPKERQRDGQAAKVMFWQTQRHCEASRDNYTVPKTIHQTLVLPKHDLA